MSDVDKTFCARLGVAHPIIQAPHGRRRDTPALVAAVSNAGGLGFIGAAYLTPRRSRRLCGRCGRGQSRPFGINLFAPLATPEAEPSVDPQPCSRASPVTTLSSVCRRRLLPRRRPTRSRRTACGG